MQRGLGACNRLYLPKDDVPMELRPVNFGLLILEETVDGGHQPTQNEMTHDVQLVLVALLLWETLLRYVELQSVPQSIHA